MKQHFGNAASAAALLAFVSLYSIYAYLDFCYPDRLISPPALLGPTLMMCGWRLKRESLKESHPQPNDVFATGRFATFLLLFGFFPMLAIGLFHEYLYSVYGLVIVVFSLLHGLWLGERHAKTTPKQSAFTGLMAALGYIALFVRMDWLIVLFALPLPYMAHRLNLWMIKHRIHDPFFGVSVSLGLIWSFLADSIFRQIFHETTSWFLGIRVLAFLLFFAWAFIPWHAISGGLRRFASVDPAPST